jgi:hypothetical protein
MRTKCARKRECDFFITGAATAYGFYLQKCTHFSVPEHSTLNQQTNNHPKLTISDQN